MSCPNNETTKLKTRQEDNCKENCSFNFKYNSNSTCKLINHGDYLEIKTDGTNEVTYNSQDLKLDDVRLYIPSLHTFDGKPTDAELILKHNGGTKNFMVCLPIKANKGTGDSVNFFKQFASHIPLAKNSPTVVNVQNCSLNNVMPAPKTPFYHYIGDSPYPPCNMQATMIVFDHNHASTINTADLELIKKTIKPAKKSTSPSKDKEGFVGGMIGGFKEGFVAYNSSGANNTETDDQSQAMECTEYYDTDPTSTSGDSASTKKPSIDWSKITKSPAFIIIIVLLSILAGGIFFYYVLWPMIRKRLDGVPVANESELKIPEGGTTSE